MQGLTGLNTLYIYVNKTIPQVYRTKYSQYYVQNGGRGQANLVYVIPNYFPRARRTEYLQYSHQHRTAIKSALGSQIQILRWGATRCPFLIQKNLSLQESTTELNGFCAE